MAENSVKLTYYQRNRDLALKRAKEYYHANKDKINKRLRDKYSNLLEEKRQKEENMKRTGEKTFLKNKK